MRRSIPLVLGGLLVCTPIVGFAGPPAETVRRPVTVAVETTLSTAADQIRQFAFDGDAHTYFASAQNPGRHDHFTMVFDQPVTVRSIGVVTGRPDGSDRLDAGTLEVSADGRVFRKLAEFAGGTTRGQTDGLVIKAVRVKPARAAKHPLAIREFSFESDPPLAVFKYPIEFVVDAAGAPEMKEWAEKAARVCEQSYPMINEELKSDHFKPPHRVKLTLSNSYRGVADTSGDHIVASVRWFKAHPDAVGALVHETVHVVQHYHHGTGGPSWLVEGVSDYVRFFKFEPGKLGRIDPNSARYNGSYRVTAAFLAYLVAKYDKHIVLKLNQIMREGQYKEEVFERLTGKKVQALDEEWRATLKQ